MDWLTVNNDDGTSDEPFAKLFRREAMLSTSAPPTVSAFKSSSG